MIFRIVGEILLGALATFGFLCAARLLIDALTFSGAVRVAVVIPNREVRQNLEPLLAEARAAPTCRSSTRLAVLYESRALCEDEALTSEELKLLSRYRADYYVIKSSNKEN